VVVKSFKLAKISFPDIRFAGECVRILPVDFNVTRIIRFAHFDEDVDAGEETSSREIRWTLNTSFAERGNTGNERGKETETLNGNVNKSSRQTV